MGYDLMEVARDRFGWRGETGPEARSKLQIISGRVLARRAAFYDIHADEADVIGEIFAAGEFLRFVDQFVEQQSAGQIHVPTDGLP